MEIIAGRDIITERLVLVEREVNNYSRVDSHTSRVPSTRKGTFVGGPSRASARTVVSGRRRG